jgi:hypothetical protein
LYGSNAVYGFLDSGGRSTVLSLNEHLLLELLDRADADTDCPSGLQDAGALR